MNTRSIQPNNSRSVWWALTLCALLVAQSVVPLSAMTIVAMRCTATGPVTAVAVEGASAPGQRIEYAMPECCRHMKLDCPMAKRARAEAKQRRSSSSSRPFASPLPTEPMQCKLAITATGSDRPATYTATAASVSHPSLGAAAPAPRVSVAAAEPALAAWHTRPPPAKQSLICLQTRPLRAPPAA